MALGTRKKSKTEKIATVKSTSHKKRKKSKLVWIIVIVAVLAAVAAFAFSKRSGKKPGEQTEEQLLYATVEARDITSELSQSGVLEPADSYTLSSLVSGEILLADFNTGDTVKKDDILYKIDSSDLSTTIKRAENSVTKSQKKYDELRDSRTELEVTSPIKGVVTGLNSVVDDMVNKNALVATVEDTSKLLLTEYYSDEFAAQIRTGMAATVSVPDQMLTLPGTVKEVSDLKRVSDTGISCFAVTIEVNNPGSLAIGHAATCWLGETGQEIYPSITDEDGLDAHERCNVYCGISGKVSQVCVRNNETIAAGQTILLLTSDTLEDEIADAYDALEDEQLSRQSQYDKLENYTLKAPIDGTIVDKFYKQGENAEMGSVLCTIFDLSNLTMTLDVDELDIGQIQVGQKAVITSDANEGVEYGGIITEVGINGTASNGVTTYPVTVRIDKPDGLLPGMNVNVSIVTQQRLGVLTLPTAAVQTGSRVLVKTADGSTGEGAPEGYEYARVEIGVSDEEYVEIVSGLEVGTEVAYRKDTADSGNSGGQMGGMLGMGGMPGMGGMGGMGGNNGGNRSGGNNGGNRSGGNSGGNRSGSNSGGNRSGGGGGNR